MKRIHYIFLIVLLCVSSLNINLAFGAEYFVQVTGAGSKDGSTWEDAMGNDEFAASLINASPGDTFYLAAGTYYPKLDMEGGIGDKYTKVFSLKPGVSIIGSFNNRLTGQAKDYTEHSNMRTIRMASGELNPTTVFSGNLIEDGDSSFDRDSYYLLRANNIGLADPDTNVINGIHFTKSYFCGINMHTANLILQYCKLSAMESPTLNPDQISDWDPENPGASEIAEWGSIIKCINGCLRLENTEISDNTISFPIELLEGDEIPLLFVSPIYLAYTDFKMYNSTIVNNKSAGAAVFYIESPDPRIF